MEFIPKNPVMEFNTDQLKLVRQRYNFDKQGDLSRAIDVLEAWVKQQKHFTKKELPRSFLEKMIIANKGSLERAKTKLDKICTLRTMIPAYFEENLKKMRFEDLYIASSILLPKPTEDHNRVYLLKISGCTLTAELFSNFYKYVVLITEYIMAHDYNDGIIVIIDYREVNMMELLKLRDFTDLHQTSIIITEGFSMRLKGIHLITPSKSIEILVNLAKHIINPKIMQRICVHSDINTVYQHVPKDLFPIDYGGKEKSFAELRDNLLNEISGEVFRNYFEEMNKAKTDESCRQTYIFNEHYLGIPGSFRTLNVD